VNHGIRITVESGTSDPDSAQIRWCERPSYLLLSYTYLGAFDLAKLRISTLYLLQAPREALEESKRLNTREMSYIRRLIVDEYHNYPVNQNSKLPPRLPQLPHSKPKTPNHATMLTPRPMHPMYYVTKREKKTSKPASHSAWYIRHQTQNSEPCRKTNLQAHNNGNRRNP
jgi:hypothetical protein